MSKDTIRQFVAELKSRSPEEVMGEAATSKLTGSVIKAAVAWIGSLLVLTVVVFLLGGGPDSRNVASEANEKPAAAEPANVETPAESQAATSQGPADTDTSAEGSTVEQAADAMGIRETKDADAKTESMENRLDKILDSLE